MNLSGLDVLALIWFSLTYILTPILLIWGCIRLWKQCKPQNIPSWFALSGFSFASASFFLAFSTLLYVRFVRSFPYFDQTLLTIYRWGFFMSLVGLILSIVGVWRPGPLRWHALVVSFTTLLFWFGAATGE